MLKGYKASVDTPLVKLFSVKMLHFLVTDCDCEFMVISAIDYVA